MNATHLPWRVTEYGEVLGANGRTVVVNGFATVASPGDWQNEARGNAASVVLAVNSHDALVSALIEAREQIAEMVEAWDEPARPGLWRANSLGVLDRIDAALHSTEGERK